MILLLGVHVLDILFVVDEVWHRADEILARIEDIQHRHAVLIKRESVVQLHLAVDAGVIPFLEVDALALKERADALRALRAPNGGVAHTEDVPPLKIRVFCLNALHLAGHCRRLHLHTLVRCARASVIFPDVVEPPIMVDREPADGKRP